MIINARKVLIVAGATASGKSGFALEIAKACSGVIINADSMQVYDGLHMLTAHPSIEDKSIVPHYLYGELSPTQDYSAAMWRDMAIDAINKAHATGKLPIITGGTGLYFKALTEGLSLIPQIPDEVRESTIDIYNKLGREQFAVELSKLDTEIIKRIDMLNPQRMMRAWEVLEATGKSLAYWQDMPREGVPDNIKFIKTVLQPDRDILYQRCNERFELMVENGALDEVTEFCSLIDNEKINSDVALVNALGFKELSDYLVGNCSIDEAISKAQQVTRNYAKRQMTWFRNQMSDAEIIENATKANIDKVISHLQE